ncbi:MAG: nuclear transport factor 2 family protein [Acidimicrobiales bacterium]
MSDRKAVVAAYIDGFRRTDHQAIHSCLTDNVVWIIHGHRTLQGRDTFDGEIENDATIGGPKLQIDHMIEEGDTVVAIGHGAMTLKDAGGVAFVFAEVFTFAGELISRIETFHINLGDGSPGTIAAPGAREVTRGGESPIA